MAGEVSRSVRALRDQSVGHQRSATARAQALDAHKGEVLEARRQSEEAHKLTENANRAKSELLARVGEDIRSPLHSILGMTELALETRLLPEQRGYLNTVKESARGLLAILEEIQDYTKLGLARRESWPIAFELRDLAGDALKLLASRARERRVDLVQRVEPSVPDALVGDPDRLRHVLINLAGAAIKRAEACEVVLRVAVESTSEAGVELHFTVEGAGPGAGSVPPPSTSLAGQLAELLGGKVWAEERAGQGAAVHFSARFGLGVAAGADLAPGLADLLRGERALVVAGGAACREALEACMRGAGMDVEAVAGVDAATAWLQAAAAAGRPAGALVLDAGLGGEEARSAARRLREAPGFPDAWVLLSADLDEPGAEARWSEAGASHRLTKPAKGVEVLEALARALAARSPKPAA
ncbi:MAG: hypothetical protein HY721_08110 [Planctomycetes bacterium]|nr:hypothetical protein [Planctomycetota bacterium]